MGIPPWALVAGLFGIIHGSLFHILFGAALRQLPPALGIALAGSLTAGLLGTAIPPATLAIGEANLIATAIGAWLALGIGRLFRLC